MKKVETKDLKPSRPARGIFIQVNLLVSNVMSINKQLHIWNTFGVTTSHLLKPEDITICICIYLVSVA